MRLHEALDHLAVIRAQVLRSELGEALRAAPTAATGMLALGLATWQTTVAPPLDGESFTRAWLNLAIVAAAVCGADLAWRASRASGDERRRMAHALSQLIPPIAAGALLSLVMLDTASTALLPGIWALLFGVSLNAAGAWLPRGSVWVAAFYAASGALLLLLAVANPVPQPVGMGLTFGLGQLWCARVLRRARSQREVVA
jgi:hypothetical protein